MSSKVEVNHFTYHFRQSTEIGVFTIVYSTLLLRSSYEKKTNQQRKPQTAAQFVPFVAYLSRPDDKNENPQKLPLHHSSHHEIHLLCC